MPGGQPTGIVISYSEKISDMEFSPDGSQLLVGAWDSSARLWEVSTGRSLPLRLEHDSQVYSVTFRQNGKQVDNRKF